jgi:hypothetical protein
MKSKAQIREMLAEVRQEREKLKAELPRSPRHLDGDYGRLSEGRPRAPLVRGDHWLDCLAQRHHRPVVASTSLDIPCGGLRRDSHNATLARLKISTLINGWACVRIRG